MFFRSFRKPPPPSPDDAAWWHAAAEAERVPTVEALDGLRATMTSGDVSPDDAERQEEMIDGLDRLRAVAARSELPVLATQHRVIRQAACHFAAPASLNGEIDASGKLFVTSDGLVFAGGRVLAWPWHRVRAVVRSERAIVVTVAGVPEPVRIICNTYGDAMTARHLAARLRPA